MNRETALTTDMALLFPALALSKDGTEALDKSGTDPITSTPAELADMVKDSIEKCAKIVKQAGVKPERGCDIPWLYDLQGTRQTSRPRSTP